MHVAFSEMFIDGSILDARAFPPTNWYRWGDGTMSGVTSLKRYQSFDYRFIAEKIEALRINALDVKLRAGKSQEIVETRSSGDRCVFCYSMDCYEHHENGVV